MENDFTSQLDKHLPPSYKIIMYDDDQIDDQFILFILQKYFNKSPSERGSIVKRLRRDGSITIDTCRFEIAEVKVTAIANESAAQSYPLLCSHEKVD